MDAELEMSLRSTIEKLAAELRNRLSELETLQANAATDLKSMHLKLNACISDCARLDTRVARLEGKESLQDLPLDGILQFKQEAAGLVVSNSTVDALGANSYRPQVERRSLRVAEDDELNAVADSQRLSR